MIYINISIVQSFFNQPINHSIIQPLLNTAKIWFPRKHASMGAIVIDMLLLVDIYIYRERRQFPGLHTVPVMIHD